MDYDKLRRQIDKKLKETTKELKKIGYETRRIHPREFYDYVTGETPTSDVISVADILDNEFLLVHEVVEISELKKLGIKINKHTIITFYPQVLETHVIAFECELNYALSKQNCEWIKIRIKNAKSWLEDDTMPQHLVKRCKGIIKKFSNNL